MKYRILKILFLVWMILWLMFVARELFVKSNIADYRALLSRTLEGKRSYVTGDRLYDFLTFCRKNLPPDAAYELAGVEDGSIEKRRAVYYLYPALESRDPEFILFYDIAGPARGGYEKSASMDGSRYILKKMKER